MLTARDRKAGFTLVEVLLYIALVAFVIGAGVTSAYYILDANNRLQSTATIHQEANFVLRKFEWLMAEATVIHSPPLGSVGNALSIDRIGVGTIELDRDPTNSRIRMRRLTTPATEEYLTSEWVTVASLDFSHNVSGAEPESVTMSFTIGGKSFSSTKYLRQ